MQRTTLVVLAASALFMALFFGLLPRYAMFKPTTSPRSLGAVLSSAIPCGQICSYSSHSSTPGKFFPTLHKRMQCDDILGRLLVNEPAKDWPPPKDIPLQQVGNFTMDGRCTVGSWYIAQRYSSGAAFEPNWSKDMIEKQMAQHKAGGTIGTYGAVEDQCVAESMRVYNHAIRDKRGLVVGSEKPWVEVIGLVNGAAKMDTLEYGMILTGHPQMRSWLPEQFAINILKGGPQYDFAFSFSSLEHSGLGRYGDALNPFGDLEATSQIWCALKPGGFLFVAVPVENRGTWESCKVFWNAHRHYGVQRFQHLFANFEQVGAICKDHYQPILVVRKPE